MVKSLTPATARAEAKADGALNDLDSAFEAQAGPIQWT